MEDVLLESGQWLRTHDQGHCFGRKCAIHHPVPGPQDGWPRVWDGQREILERTCPHGIDHPVNEMYDHAIESGHAIELVHGCCKECVCAARATKRFTPSGTVISLPDATQPSPAPVAPVVGHQIPEGVGEGAVLEALTLATELWPRGNEDRIMIDKAQWERLRRVLLTFPALWMEVTSSHVE